MCGRFSDTSEPEKISRILRILSPKLAKRKPRYNIAPSQPVTAVIQSGVEFLTWGLVPSWAKDPAIGARMINARSETLKEKPSFKGPFKNSRCLIIADGFYEWKQEEKRKQPYYIRLKSHEPFTFAGLWSRWAGGDGSEILSCSIITTQANDLLKPIHERMPVILEREHYDEWLDPRNYNTETLSKRLRAYPDELMEAYPVTTYVNKPENNDAQCIKPLR